MNIFILDENPKKAAKYHNNKHVVKMILESVQMLMSSYHVTNHATALQDPNMYRLTHKHHPCTEWVNTSYSNWCWLYKMTRALNKEFMLRFNRSERHLSLRKLDAIIAKYGTPKLPRLGRTEFALAMPDCCKVEDDAVASYRKYYMEEKQHIAKWSTHIPTWYKKRKTEC